MTSPVEQRVNDLRLDRRALRAEHARVAWWRRLVRARLDLAVAQAARPQALGEEMAFQLPLDVSLDVPRPADLAAVLDAGTEAVDRLGELRALDEQLSTYAAGVEEALTRATDRLITRLAADPGIAVAGLPEPLGRG
ncbi:hypothetical protein [Cellulomonas sp. Leaf395]|uniref:hypothetical protein n=1 Tax=Cellulomonas sp. Leaf395 TaxID=1736362 RepID=UPI000701901E|nr:hypothetical protein [Cellulomonas sp. Leaf395]KQS98813.1 hypothetical protein ASG23_13825 [Cellulomonas sp. Leaf395]